MQAPVGNPVAPASRLANLPLADYAPEATVVLERTVVERPRFPVIDAHAHLGRWLAPGEDWLAADVAGRCEGPWMTPDVGALIELLDAHEVGACVNLDGRWGSELEANLDRYDRAHPSRFLTFCQLDWTLAAAGDDFAVPLVASLRRSVAAGARGLKVWKTLGLAFRDAAGELLLPDDERAAAGLRRRRRARPAGAHSHRRSTRLLRPGRRSQRAPGGAPPPSGVVVRAPGLSEPRAPDGVVRGAGRGTP